MTSPTLFPLDNTRTFAVMAHYGGSFARALAEAWSVADPVNKRRLEAAFPDYVAKYGPGSPFFSAA